MKSHSVFAALFCLGVVLATPFTELRREPRQAGTRRTIGPQEIANTGETDERVAQAANVAATGDGRVQYTQNWAGLVLTGNNYTSVTGTIIVPTPKSPLGANARTQYAASAWVGIDGNTCPTAILQTGVDFYIQAGRISFDGWYQWFPNSAYRFGSFRLSAGHTIQMTVTATSTSSGTATLTNLSTGQTVSNSFSRQTSKLCEVDAEWIVEDFSRGSNLVPFIDFTTVTFTGASAVSGGSTVDTTGGTVINIRQKGQVLTSCAGSGSKVSCTYI
jgi:hypothetical protein